MNKLLFIISYVIIACLFVYILDMYTAKKQEDKKKQEESKSVESKLTEEQINDIHSRGKITPEEKVKEWEDMDLCAPGDAIGSAAWKCKKFQNNCHDCLIDYSNEQDEYTSFYKKMEIHNIEYKSIKESKDYIGTYYQIGQDTTGKYQTRRDIICKIIDADEKNLHICGYLYLPGYTTAKFMVKMPYTDFNIGLKQNHILGRHQIETDDFRIVNRIPEMISRTDNVLGACKSDLIMFGKKLQALPLKEKEMIENKPNFTP